MESKSESTKWWKNKSAYIILIFAFFVSCTDEKIEGFSSAEKISLKIKINNKEYLIPLKYRTEEQATQERIFENLDLKFEFKIGGIEDTSLFLAQYVQNQMRMEIFMFWINPTAK